MTSLFTDYGYWDGKIATTNAPDKFTAAPSADQIGRLVYEANQSAESARIYLNRLERAAESLHGWKATEDQLQGVIDSCRDVEMALAVAIAKLCPEPKAQPIESFRADAARDAA